MVPRGQIVHPSVSREAVGKDASMVEENGSYSPNATFL